jgi:hypothetical protein
MAIALILCKLSYSGILVHGLFHCDADQGFYFDNTLQKFAICQRSFTSTFFLGQIFVLW